MGNAFMNLRKMEVSKVAPNRAALIGKFNQSMNSGNMSAMKEVEKADKNGSVFCSGYHMRQSFREREQDQQLMYITNNGKTSISIYIIVQHKMAVRVLR